MIFRRSDDSRVRGYTPWLTELILNSGTRRAGIAARVNQSLHSRGSVCSVRPGLTLTEIFEGTLGQEGASELARRAVPMGRIGRPEEVAAMVLWLCSPEAGWVTGHLIFSDGGYLLA